jgi:hypothetical protein
MENRRELGKERQRLLMPPIGDADWHGQSRMVVVVFDEFNFGVDAKIDGRAASIGSQQQVQFVEQDVPLGLDAFRVYERAAHSPIHGHYVRQPRLPARAEGFAKPGTQAERALFVNAWTGRD